VPPFTLLTTRLDVPRDGAPVPSLHFVTDQLATGGDLPFDDESARRHLAAWQELGITHVVDNRLEADDTDYVAEWAPEIAYLHNGVDDAGQRMPDAWFDTGVSFIADTLRQPGTKVLTHCHMGINRGPSMAYAALLADGWDAVDAIAAIRSVREIAAVGYAEDALAWHHRRSGASHTQRSVDRHRLARWRADNWIDVVRIIRTIRSAEAG
jgi:dual specificity phosphatase 3